MISTPHKYTMPFPVGLNSHKKLSLLGTLQLYWFTRNMHAAVTMHILILGDGVNMSAETRENSDLYTAWPKTHSVLD